MLCLLLLIIILQFPLFLGADVAQGYNGRPGPALLGGNHVDLQTQPQRREAVPELHLNVFVSSGQFPQKPFTLTDGHHPFSVRLVHIGQDIAAKLCGVAPVPRQHRPTARLRQPYRIIAVLRQVHIENTHIHAIDGLKR